jgi:hypothetical protein
VAHSKSGLPINGFAFFINQRLPLVIFIYKNIFKRLAHLCSDTKFNEGLLDIDTSEVIANKADAQRTYKGNKGYMPMVGHIAQTGQIVASQSNNQ